MVNVFVVLPLLWLSNDTVVTVPCAEFYALVAMSLTVKPETVRLFLVGQRIVIDQGERNAQPYPSASKWVRLRFNHTTTLRATVAGSSPASLRLLLGQEHLDPTLCGFHLRWWPGHHRCRP